MRLALLTALAALSSVAYSQLEVTEITLEPTKDDSSIYLFQQKYKDHLNSKSTPTILYFCPIRNYSKAEYSEKIGLLKSSPLLKNLNQKVNMYLFYFTENDVNDKSGVQYKTGEWVNESTCFFIHFDQSNLQRLAANFPREYRIETTGDAASTKVILFDANRCFPDVPTRLVAYARSIMECAQPNYSDTEVNQFQNKDIEDLKRGLKEAQKNLEENSKNDATQGEQLFELKDRMNKTKGKIDTLQSNISDADIVLQAYTSLQPDYEDNGIGVQQSGGSGWLVGLRKLIPGLSSSSASVYATLGVSASSQKATLSRDSVMVEYQATDVNGIQYTHRDYYKNLEEQVNIASMSIPMGLQYHITPNGLRNLKFILEGGAQLQFIQQTQNQLLGGSVSSAGVYDGFDKEIRNVFDLGFIDNQEVEGDSNPNLFREEVIGGFAGLQIEWRISPMLHINLNSRYQYSGNWLSTDSQSNASAPSSALTTYRQNPYQLGLGLTYSFKQ